MAAADAALRDDEVLSYLLAGLPSEYDPYVTTMTTMASVTLDDAYAHLVAFEARQLKHQAALQLNVGSSANYAGRGNNNQNRRRSNNQNRGRGSNQNRGHGGALPRANSDRRSTPSSKPTCQICGKVGHTAIRCWYRMDEAYNEDPPSAAFASTSSKVDTDWYTDTGATDHITSDLDRLAVRERYHGNDQVQVGNGTGLPIKHTGHCSIHTAARPLALRKVLHVPQIAKNLLSVHKFSRDNDVFFEYHPWHFSVKDRQSRKSLLEGRCESGLYPIKATDVPPLKRALATRTISSSQWHARLGHPSPQIVRSILVLNKIPCSRDSTPSICNACQLAKSHQLPYSSSVHHSSSPLDLIFSDVWGPAPTSVGGYKYYISFIDDFSKFSWIYLMHDRSEAPRIFMQFKTHIERLLDTTIKRVQSDWGGEYRKMHITFFSAFGITHHVSCPQTHQQNGSAERKHRHIVETGLALLAHAHVPLKFWDDAFLTATYLINRMPTRVIDNSSPLERLFHTKPNYSLLRVFGCACWPHLRAYNKNKLAFRSTECVFLGYSSLHKGYKCLDRSFGRVYVSRDVVFDEHVFPFYQHSTNPASSLRSLHLDNSSVNLNFDRMCTPVSANPLSAETLPSEYVLTTVPIIAGAGPISSDACARFGVFRGHAPAG